MTTDLPVYTAHDIPDLINALPTLFGFRPEESLVAVATHGPRRRFGFRLRIDLPDEDDHDVVAQLIVGHLVRHGAEGVVLIAVTERQKCAASLLAALEARVCPPIEVVVSVRTNGRQFWTDEPGFPERGREVCVSDHHPAIVHAVAAGQQILPSRAAVERRFAVVPEPQRTTLRQATSQAISSFDERVGELADPDIAEVGRAVVEPILRRGLAGERLTDAQVVDLAACLTWAPVRDVVWRMVDRSNAAEMLQALTDCAPRVVGPPEAAFLGITAFAAWLSGDGAQALMALDRALEADPADVMSNLMLGVIERGVPPATWTGWGATGTPCT